LAALLRLGRSNSSLFTFQPNIGVNPTVISPVPVPAPAQGPPSAANSTYSKSSALLDTKMGAAPPLINPALQYNPHCLTRNISFF
jgi:hypothetical protein